MSNRRDSVSLGRREERKIYTPGVFLMEFEVSG